MVHAVLDSNQLILHVNGEQVIEFDAYAVAISALTVFECMRYSGMSESEEEKMGQILSLCDIVSVSKSIALRAATIAKTRRSRPVDLLIASTALELGVPLITANIKDFKGIPNLVMRTRL